MRISFRLAILLLAAVLAIRSGLVLRTELAGIRLYQATFSRVLAATGAVKCRFHPTCSVYAVQVLRVQGFRRGNIAIIRRLLACSPVGYFADKYAAHAPTEPRLTAAYAAKQHLGVASRLQYRDRKGATR